MVGRIPLEDVIGVRVPASQHFDFHFVQISVSASFTKVQDYDSPSIMARKSKSLRSFSDEVPYSSVFGRLYRKNTKLNRAK